MGYHALQRMLTVYRDRQQARLGTGWKAPLFMEYSLSPEHRGPYFVSNSKGVLVPSRPREGNQLRCAFCVAPLGDAEPLEPVMMQRVYDVVSDVGVFPTVASAVQALVDPKVVVVHKDMLRETGVSNPQEVAEHCRRMELTGCVAMVGQMMVLIGDGLEPGQALVLTHPSRTGVYNRVGNYLGMWLAGVGATMVAVKTSV